jgi:hypothetical protein
VHTIPNIINNATHYPLKHFISIATLYTKYFSKFFLKKACLHITSSTTVVAIKTKKIPLKLRNILRMAKVKMEIE